MSKGPITPVMRDTLRIMVRGAELRRPSSVSRSYRLDHASGHGPFLVDGRAIWRDTGQVRAMLGRGLIIGNAGNDADAGDIFGLTELGTKEALTS